MTYTTNTGRTVYFPTEHTPEEWRAMSGRQHEASRESFDRCDTDGCLTQWAADTMGRLYSFIADLAENGGRATFRKLADLDGNILDAREVHTRYGYAWAITNPDGSTTWFHESEARKASTRTANNAKKGFKFVAVEGPAVVMLSDSWQPTPFRVPMRGAEMVVLGDWDEVDD